MHMMLKSSGFEFGIMIWGTILISGIIALFIRPGMRTLLPYSFLPPLLKVGKTVTH